MTGTCRISCSLPQIRVLTTTGTEMTPWLGSGILSATRIEVSVAVSALAVSCAANRCSETCALDAGSSSAYIAGTRSWVQAAT